MEIPINTYSEYHCNFPGEFVQVPPPGNEAAIAICVGPDDSMWVWLPHEVQVSSSQLIKVINDTEVSVKDGVVYICLSDMWRDPEVLRLLECLGYKHYTSDAPACVDFKYSIKYRCCGLVEHVSYYASTIGGGFCFAVDPEHTQVLATVQRGVITFAGCAQEPNETLVDTALQALFEKTGVDIDNVTDIRLMHLSSNAGARDQYINDTTTVFGCTLPIPPDTTWIPIQNILKQKAVDIDGEIVKIDSVFKRCLKQYIRGKGLVLQKHKFGISFWV